MIELKRVLAPVDGTSYDEICSFETTNYIGIYIDCFPGEIGDGFVIMPKDEYEFSLGFVKSNDSLEKLDDAVYDRVDEHIISVSTSRCLNIRIVEE